VQYHKVSYIVEAVKEWIKNNRLMPVGELMKKINQKLVELIGSD